MFRYFLSKTECQVDAWLTKPTVSIFCDIDTNIMEAGKKRSSTGAERHSKYVKNNPYKAKLSEAKRQFERMKVLHSDSYQAQ